MALNKYESCPIPRPKNMPKSESWRCPAKRYIPYCQTSLTSKQESKKS